MKINELERAILALTDANDIKRVISAIREVQSERSDKAISAFKRGDTVRFNARGAMIIGVVDKINRKTMSLRSCMFERSQQPCSPWRVSATLCTIVPK